MNIFSQLSFDVWCDGKQDMCSIRADIDQVQRASYGLSHVWFVMYRRELYQLIEGEITTTSDGYHKLTTFGESWTFYTQEIPRDASGVMQCPYVSVTFPRTFMRSIFRLMTRAWPRQREALDSGADPHDVRRVQIHVTQEQRKHALEVFGQGRGLVDIEPSDPETTEWLSRCEREGGQSFADMWQRVQTIARNTTSGRHERAKVRVSRDGSRWDEGFYWAAITPRGKRTLTGGLINRGGREGRPAHDWSIHT